MEINKHKFYIRFIIYLLIFYSSNIYALKLNYGLGAGIEYSDNLIRTPENQISDSIQIYSLVADLTHESESIDFQFAPRILHYNYNPVEINDQTQYQLDSSLVWEIVDSTLSWSIEDFIAQTSIDVTQPDIPVNQQNTNVFFTGPDLKFKAGYGKDIILLIRYADFYYEIDDTVDNERVGGLLTFSNQSSPETTYSFNLATADIRYKDTVVNEDYLRNDIFLGLKRITNKYNFNIDAGYTVIDRDISEELDGALVHLNLETKIGANSNIVLLGRREYTDSSRNFLTSRFLSEELRRYNTAISGEILYEKSLLAAYNWNDTVTNIILQMSITKQDYEEESLNNLDRDINTVSLNFIRQATGLLEAYINAIWSNTEYTGAIIEDNDTTFRVGMNYRLSRSLNLNTFYQFASRDSTDITREYTENSFFIAIGLRR